MHRAPASADVFHAIADPTRRRILDLLAEKERPAQELLAPFRISQPAISQHLAVLHAAGLVGRRPEGRMRVYHVVPGQLEQVFDWVRQYEKFWDVKLNALGRYLDRRKRNKR